MLVKIYNSVEKLERCEFARTAGNFAEELKFGIEKAKRHTPDGAHWLWCAFIRPKKVELSHFMLNMGRQFIVHRTIRNNLQIRPFCLALEELYPGYPVKIIRRVDFFDRSRETLLYRFSNRYTTKEYEQKKPMPREPFHYITEDNFGDKWNELMEIEGTHTVEMPASIAARDDVMEYLDKNGFIAFEETLPLTLGKRR